MKTVYCDVVFTVNFLMDLCVLFSCSRCLNISVKAKRILLASFAGGAFALITAILINNSFVRFLSGAAFCAVLCIIAFGSSSPHKLCVSTLLFWIISAALCGAVFTVSSFFQYSFVNGKESYAAMAVGAVTGAMVITYLCRAALRRKVCKTVDVYIEFCGDNRKFKLLVDSANLLIDPYSKLPVIVVKNEFSKALDFNNFFKNKVRYIPVRTASSDGIIMAIKPDSVIMVLNKKSVKLDAVLGFSINDSADYGGTDGVIPYRLIENI